MWPSLLAGLALLATQAQALYFYIDGPSPCLEGIGDTFLFSRTATLPARDTRCSTTPLFFDSRVYNLSGPVAGGKSVAKKTIKAKNTKVKATRADVAKRGLS